MHRSFKKMRQAFYITFVLFLACSGHKEPSRNSNEAKSASITSGDVLETEHMIAARLPFIHTIRERIKKNKSILDIKIRHGIESSDVPAITALLFGGKAHCTATVIAERTALTAAHCVYGYDKKLMKLAVGPRIRDSEEYYQITETKVHEDYQERQPGAPLPPPDELHDIALLYLERPFAHGTVPLPESTYSAELKGKALFFVGYGFSRVGFQRSSGMGEKRYAVMTVSEVTTRSFSYSDDRHGTCRGDSGGPALIGTLAHPASIIGVTSNGDRRCAQKQTNIRVDAYGPWIRQHLR